MAGSNCSTMVYLHFKKSAGLCMYEIAIRSSTWENYMGLGQSKDAKRNFLLWSVSSSHILANHDDHVSRFVERSRLQRFYSFAPNRYGTARFLCTAFRKVPVS